MPALLLPAFRNTPRSSSTLTHPTDLYGPGTCLAAPRTMRGHTSGAKQQGRRPRDPTLRIDGHNARPDRRRATIRQEPRDNGGYNMGAPELYTMPSQTRQVRPASGKEFSSLTPSHCSLYCTCWQHGREQARGAGRFGLAYGAQGPKAWTRQAADSQSDNHHYRATTT